MKTLLCKCCLTLGWLVALGSGVYAQYDAKSLEAVRTEVVPKLDGQLDDACWQNARIGNGFVMNTPTPGIPLPQETEVRVLYHEDAVYIAIMCFDTAPDSILHELCGRDKNCNTDFAGVVFSCYRDGMNGFAFYSSPNGEQYDARMDNEGDDATWNAVWYSKAKIVENGWSLEMKIPFAAIRFPNVVEQNWNINF
ncbi:MAG: carbohydrate binding family 9 domain-containing protein, partial [Flavobacteriales bacterium]